MANWGGGAAQYLRKIKEETVGEKKEPITSPTSMAALTDQLEKRRPTYLKLNPAKSYTQEDSPNYTQSCGNRDDLPSL